MLRRALVAEGLGSMLLGGDRDLAPESWPNDSAGGNLAVALLANTAATVAVLATLIALLGSRQRPRTSIRRSRSLRHCAEN